MNFDDRGSVQDPGGARFPIVAIGASAGGLDPLQQFFDALPDAPGAAFIIVQHLDPTKSSILPSLLARRTKIPVRQAAEGDVLAPDTVLVIAPETIISVEDGRIRTQPRTQTTGDPHTFDVLLHSLAAGCAPQSVAVILSGSGADGAHGAAALKAAGGVVIAQDPAEAAYDGMPRSAIDAGAADLTLPVAEIPAAAIRLAREALAADARAFGDRARPILADVADRLRAATGLDFSLYKEGTLLRRIERRMGVRAAPDPAAYLALLQREPEEARQLARDLLIRVTAFFRDATHFGVLAEEALPEKLATHPAGRPFRIWTAGCASGEEAYTVAMIALELAHASTRPIEIQIFATDLSPEALDIARAGLYPSVIETQVSPERLARFFRREEHGWRVSNELREAIVFAPHNLLSDPPFSRLDLITCRNLLIYLDQDAQRRVLDRFRFALTEGGLLMLGSSETVGAEDSGFEAVSKTARIYRRSGHERQSVFALPFEPYRGRTAQGAAAPTGQSSHSRPRASAAEMTRRALLERFAPASALVNRRGQVLYFHGALDRYLQVPSGEPDADVMAMARQGLRVKLRAVFRAALEDDAPASVEGAWIRANGGRVQVRVEAHPISDHEDRYVLIAFSDVASEPDGDDEPQVSDHAAVDRLERELDQVRRELKSTISELEVSNEDLKASNEEAMSMNEEFQSTNEELETSKEELQAMNEELTAVNAELAEKIEEHRSTADDLVNLLSSTRIATVMLDRELRITRFTAPATKLFGLIRTDHGRPFSDIRPRVDDPALLSEARRVLDGGHATSAVVASEDGRVFSRRVLPYRRDGKQIDGVVFTYTDISELKMSEQGADSARAYADALATTVQEPLLALDEKLRVVTASAAMRKTFHLPAVVEGVPLAKLGGGVWRIPELERALRAALERDEPITGLRIESDFGPAGPRRLVLNGRRAPGPTLTEKHLLLSITDVTRHETALEKLEAIEARLSSVLEAAPDAVVTVDNDGLVTALSAQAERLFGWSADALIGRSVDVVIPGALNGVENGFETFRKEPEAPVSRREVIGRRRDGSEIALELSSDAVRFDHTLCFAGVLRDLSLELVRQDELRRLRAADAVGQLTGGVAHDFNNLLSVIGGCLELIDGETLSAENRGLLADALEAVSMGAQLTERLLVYGGRSPQEPARVEPNEEMAAITALARRTVEETVTVQTDFAEDVWPVRVDPGLLRSALLNLVVNARDAMPDGGVLVLSTANTTLSPDDAALYADAAPGDYATITVRDTGVGMDAETRRRAGQPYFTTKKDRNGTGLGLSQAFGFVRQASGFVEVLSAPGEGTSVSFNLPRDAVAASPPDAGKTGDAEKELRGGGELVLIVEDDPRVRRVLSRRLAGLGYKVSEAADGPAALRALDAGLSPDALITDVMMPGGLDGVALAEEAARRRSGLRVLFTTGYAERAANLPADAPLLRKPYDVTEIATKLRTVLET